MIVVIFNFFYILLIDEGCINGWVGGKFVIDFCYCKIVGINGFFFYFFCKYIEKVYVGFIDFFGKFGFVNDGDLMIFWVNFDMLIKE